MIEGIEILNKTMITEMPRWCVITIIALLFVFAGCITIGTDICEDWIKGLCLLVGAISLVVLIGLIAFVPKQPTGRYQYEVTIEDSVQFTDICDRYDVVEQKGELWILEDKEIE